MNENPLHYLVDPTGQPVELSKEKHFFIGRAEGNNIKINDGLSSRRHLEIWWDGEYFIIQDLNSSNGTQLNGEAVISATLKDKDEIKIGLHKFIYRKVKNKSELEKTRSTVVLQQQKQETQQFASLTSATPDNDFSGTLDSVSISDLMQLLNFSRRTGLLLAKFPEGKAMIYFCEGEAIQAQYINLRGEEAIFKILVEEKGFFTFKKGQKPLEKNITTKLTQIMLEAARLKDEG